MSIEATIRGRLLGDATIVAAVVARVYYGELPQAGTLPALRFQRVSENRPSAMGSDVALVEALWQVDVWAAGLDAMADLRDAVRARLQRWRDAAASPAISDCFIEDVRDHGLDADLRAWRGAVDVRIWHAE